MVLIYYTHHIHQTLGKIMVSKKDQQKIKLILFIQHQQFYQQGYAKSKYHLS